jgi:hypothetical protein
MNGVAGVLSAKLQICFRDVPEAAPSGQKSQIFLDIVRGRTAGAVALDITRTTTHYWHHTAQWYSL